MQSGAVHHVTIIKRVEHLSSSIGYLNDTHKVLLEPKRSLWRTLIVSVEQITLTLAVDLCRFIS